MTDFLVIGAMKAGTTSLYEDLGRVPAIGRSPTKEPGFLLHDRSTVRLREQYTRNQPDESTLLRDFSTMYSIEELHPGVPTRGRDVFGSDLRIIYLVRDPIDRALSHHHHWAVRGLCASSLKDALREHPEIVGASEYGRQLAAWQAVFSSDNIRVVVFEEYVRNRLGVVADLCAFLGVDHHGVSTTEPDQIYNQGGGNRVAAGRLGATLRHPLYAEFGRRLIPGAVRRGMKRVILRDGSARPEMPQRLRDDLRSTLLDSTTAFADEQGITSSCWPTLQGS
ncbi:sulfotransferase domain-containing protein [Euzebya tangerina]|uniref:sulfotransferase domain-containing protein n=1 Tax=Euzebya tangerina TaxID=591198 RepID=UPI000E311CDF|nr:sulfotransferase domain-containing protein [Euzebya tangerina]